MFVSGSFHENLATSGTRDFRYFLTIFLSLENGGIENSEMTVVVLCCVVLCCVVLCCVVLCCVACVGV